ncbi:hypothetical protein ACPSLY_22235 [Vibrio parahaemolyticus]|uniref:hypothetical protein n=1 Tax=Vibrio parahaemolyticus TaxID=670 RepID=UPI0003A00AAF|nr:hypothetical protein [Vibrio parahaemolyticus]AYO06343.1 hypothetical protein D0871_18690 [Vibrio parahaemolyticus]EGQ9441762.1 hypothetical protein [Vibrio parahaemolyticus]EGR3368415.1 hypothetical protein [Vibrio parahaemolyticus]EHZ2904466.1 hypothetical protein [Vibrio parahaemolyticus]EIF2692933.1 hypothetical protein [Vibrio parahaemolyticus]
MRALLISFFGLFLSLLAVSVGQESSSRETTHHYTVGSAFDEDAQVSETPLAPPFHSFASLLNRNALRVHDSKSDLDELDIGWFETLAPHWNRSLSETPYLNVGLTAFLGLAKDFSHSKYQIGDGLGSNLIYRFIHAR